MLPELKVELRRTNVFLRLVLFAFGLLIIGASVLLVGVTLKMNEDLPIAILCVAAAVCCKVLAEASIKNLRLYRFGIEEAAASGFVVLLTIVIVVLLPKNLHAGEFPVVAGLVTAAVAAFWIYLRFGYVYAAIASMFCISLAPLATQWSNVTQRLVSVGFLMLVFVVARAMSTTNQNEFPGDEYRTIQAVSWLGIYAYLNLHLASIQSIFFVPEFTGAFYQFTYAVIWLLPPIGIFLGVRDRDRALLDVNILLSLITLATNKPYLHLQRQTWDPILLGLLLMGVAIGLRRWLAKGDRNGFTAARILLSDKRGMTALATASAALHTGPQAPTQPDRSFHGEGGRSGGAGASGSF